MLFLCGIAQPALVAAQGGTAPPDRKIDSALRASLAGDAPTQHVIISVGSDARLALIRSLKAHGDVIKSVHQFVGAVSAEVHSGDIETLSRNPSITGISADGKVRANGSIGLRPPVVPPAPWLASAARTAVGLTSESPTGGSVRVAILDRGSRRWPTSTDALTNSTISPGGVRRPMTTSVMARSSRA